jgi:hypothetical protein
MTTAVVNGAWWLGRLDTLFSRALFGLSTVPFFSVLLFFFISSSIDNTHFLFFSFLFLSPPQKKKAFNSGILNVESCWLFFSFVTLYYYLLISPPRPSFRPPMFLNFLCFSLFQLQFPAKK